MATEKTLKARVKMKHGKESEWALATKFTPLIGEIIVYDVDNNHTSPRFKVGDGITNVNNLKFVNQDELAKITTLGDELLAVKNGYLPLYGGTVTGTLTVNEELYSNAAIISKRNSTPQFIMQNANGAQLGSIYSSSSDGNYGNIVIVVNQDSSSASYFTFKNDGIFAAPSDIISNGGVLKSSRNTNPCLALTNQNGAWLASLAAVTSDGSYGNAQLAVYKSATEGSTFTFSNQGSFRAPSTVYSSLFVAQSNNNPQLMLQNKNGAPLGMLYMNTTTGGYSSAYLRVYSSASAYSTFNFGNDGKLSCGSLALVTALPISSGGTGSTTASGALTNLGALPLTGGTLTGTLTAKALYASDGNVVGSHLVTQTNNYPEVYFKNATGATLADFYVDTTSGGYADVRLKVFSDASTANYFTFGKDGVLDIPNSFSTVMGEFKSNAWPQLFFRNGDGNSLAQFVIPTNDGSYNGLTVNVFSDASSHVEYEFNSSGTFKAPFAVEAARTYVKTNNYPKHIFQNANGVTLAEFYANTSTGAYAPIVLKVNQDASSAGYFTFGRDGSFTASSGITTTGNYISIKNNSYPQLTFSNASGADLGKVFVSTANGSYAGTKIRAYSSASSYYDFQFVGNGTFNCATLAPTNALGIAYGGTGATTAAGACSNIGALPKSGGVISGTLTVAKNGSPSIILANASNRYSAHLSMSTSDGSYGNVLLTVYSAASTTKVFSFDNDGTFVAPNATFDGGMVEVGGDDNQGKVGLGNANMGNWIYLRSSDEGALTVDNNLVYSDGTSVIYSSSTPSTTVKGTIWLKPV